MAMDPEIIRGYLGDLEAAGIVPPETRRVIVDINTNCVATVYYECFADKRMFSIDLTKALAGADVVSVADMAEKT
jgi:hypothetical protein